MYQVSVTKLFSKVIKVTLLLMVSIGCSWFGGEENKKTLRETLLEGGMGRKLSGDEKKNEDSEKDLTEFDHINLQQARMVPPKLLSVVHPLLLNHFNHLKCHLLKKYRLIHQKKFEV